MILSVQGSLAQSSERLKSSSKIGRINIESLQNGAEIPLPALYSKAEGSVQANDLEFSREYVLEQIVKETLEIMEKKGSFLMSPIKTTDDFSQVLTRFFEENYNSLSPNKIAGVSNDRLALINVIWALGELGKPESVKTIVKAFPSADQAMRLNMIAALDKIKSAEAAAALNKITIAGQDKEFGTMETGDLLFRKGYFGLLNPIIKAQPVGHVAIYIGKENGEPMVIHSWLIVEKITLHKFIHNRPFYGNYTTSPKPSIAQRNKIVDYLVSQLGKLYSMSHLSQKGPEKFDCVGLAEAAYESAGLNPTPNEFESGWGWPLTPTEQYEHTSPNFK